jgi:DNA-binding transcriptional regulator YiaG
VTRPEAPPSETPTSVPLAQVQQARKDLGRRLACLRKGARMTQVELAGRLLYARTTVANAEIGRQTTREFWRAADRELRAGGALLAARDAVDGLAHRYRCDAAEHGMNRHRLLSDTGRHTTVRAAATGEHAEDDVLAVARWSSSEVTALRVALRCTCRAFAAGLGVSEKTVRKWEDRHQPTAPSMPMQGRLDAALTHADTPTRIRFGLLMRSSGATEPPARPQSGGTVTLMYRSARAAS